ncbi:hypothetical protein SAMN04490357_7444 [Streptomyces misionensis]|uniref:Uncharacterized protein n=1 Tax=Streptomyces misionensis TaxID=67331 RepID=A0A1H5HCJ3_9ACTN|nr:hypothetical protein SAMN04490357_7444 [Streptomyces misionensis]SFY51029.1 hypothetical protein STEPF1_04285 [Streptomyces sp. F-1]
MSGELPQAVHEEFEESESAGAENVGWVPRTRDATSRGEVPKKSLRKIRKAKEEM